MSDEHDRPGTAGDGGENDEAGGGRSQTAVANRPVTGPLRPTGKRSRRRAAGGDDTGDDTAATEVIDGGAAATTEKIKTAGKGVRAAKPGEGPSSNPALAPILYVYNYLKEVVGELRKVIWPSRKQMVTYTGVMLVFLVFMVSLIAGADFGFAKLMLLLFGE